MGRQHPGGTSLRLIALVTMSAIVTACGASAVPSSVTTRLEGQFALLDRLGVEVYWNTDACHYLSYSRGTYSQDRDNDGCWVAPYGSGLSMDDETLRDFQAIGEALARDGLRVEYISVSRDASMSTGPGTFFVEDGCTTYSYEGDDVLESEAGALEKIEPLDDGWYLISSC